MEQIAQPPEQAPRKPYHQPRLRELGPVAEVTEGSGTGGVDDGAGYPIYAS